LMSVNQLVLDGNLIATGTDGQGDAVSGCGGASGEGGNGGNGFILAP
jgi:hypothetical protein